MTQSDPIKTDNDTFTLQGADAAEVEKVEGGYYTVTMEDALTITMEDLLVRSRR